MASVQQEAVDQNVFDKLLRMLSRPFGNSTEEKQKKLQTLYSQVSGEFAGLESPVSAILASMIAFKPAIEIGLWGEGKTRIIDELAWGIDGASYFYYPATPETDKDSVLGPINIEDYKKGHLTRIHSAIYNSDIVFIDELMRGGRNIRDLMLDVLSKHEVVEGDSVEHLKYRAFFTATNTTPTAEEDMALYSRFPVRVFFNEVQKELLPSAISKGLNGEVELLEKELEGLKAKAMAQVTRKKPLSVNDLGNIQLEVNDKTLRFANNPAFTSTIANLVVALREKGIHPSTRTDISLARLAVAFSYLRGNKDVDREDLALSLYYCGPNTQDDLAKIERIIVEQKLSLTQEKIEKVEEEFQKLKEMEEIAKTTPSEITFKALRREIANADTLLGTMKNDPKMPEFTSYLSDLVVEAKAAVKKRDEEDLN